MSNFTIDLDGNRKKILNLLSSVKREGMEDFINWLEEKSDFFIAPASTRYHGNFDGGLSIHSLNVYEVFKKKCEEWGLGVSEESMIICAVLHDICKANFYNKTTRNKKDDTTGRWYKVPFYECKDEFPYGHGEKSVYILRSFFKLSRDEAMAIRWHMGSEGESQMGSIACSNAFNECKMAVLLHTADLEASRLMEQTIEY